ncbi:HAMP domain-containing histidine kinase [Mucilaginibacter corticis]|uniref:histidine kinase n=1 Tax=Mucilaginibacter corticis TaxID=2597670 RepID=A0A556MW10_9SPHI|nr:HAMP domain-containing sensor histidine kinase [Mucilaginibacter corticis]TSJ43998.1 HAMP domain-containing histidine kinase [Mucilaginibacter corticis]
MKLLDKYNRISLLTTILVIIVTGFIYYFTISYILTDQVDKDLVVEENEIFEHVKLNHNLPEVFKSEDLKILFKNIGQDTMPRQFSNTQFWDDKEKEQEAARGLQSWVRVNGVNYSIHIIESKVETEELIRLIFLITLGIILLLIIALITINRLVIRNLWQPFYDMLRQIKLFNVTDQNSITPLTTGIEEFRDMNEEISAMSTRVKQDYQELKTFVENAAHELMTPIAVMNSKLDTLIQTGGLNDEQGTLIGDMYGTMGKLTRLNKVMLLLTKIENNLINDQEALDVRATIETACSEFQDLAYNKELRLHTELTDVTLFMSKTLLDILLGNLLGNAIRHNRPGGVVTVKLNQQALIIQNTGKFDALDASTIFRRFQKASDSEGSGLGLTLARQICENNGFRLQYSFEDHLHTFTVNFK